MYDTIDRLCRNFLSTVDEVKKIRQGYNHAKYIVTDARKISVSISKDTRQSQDILQLVLQLIEYRCAWGDIEHNVNDSYSAGIVLYGIVHRKHDKFMDALYEQLSLGTKADHAEEAEVQILQN